MYFEKKNTGAARRNFNFSLSATAGSAGLGPGPVLPRFLIA